MFDIVIGWDQFLLSTVQVIMYNIQFSVALIGYNPSKLHDAWARVQYTIVVVSLLSESNNISSPLPTLLYNQHCSESIEQSSTTHRE